MARKAQPLKIIPLGGLDGIGKNMTVFEYGDDMLIIDAGLMFPDDEQLGIDLVLPDYTYVLENEDKLRGVIITHGHEDHTGCLPYLYADLTTRVPIYSSKLTLGFVQSKLDEQGIKNVDLVEVKDGTHLRLGAFTIDFFSMTHSIPAALGTFVRSPAGSVMHSCDFKLDQTPIDGVRPNYAAISQFGTSGVDLLLSDSTNATHPGFTPSEAAVGPTLRRIVKEAPGRVIVACFASHIHRVQQVCDAALAEHRKVVVTGRSMIANTRIARELGYLKIPSDDLIDAYDIDDYPQDRVVVLCTGSQGEPLSALARMANGEHKSLTINRSDTVVISATPVPGNEKSVASIINSLSKIGCTIFEKDNSLVHVSGHGSQEELKLMLAMSRPTYFVPVHGESLHLRAHEALAYEMGYDSEHVFVLENGDTLEMRDGIVRVGEPVESGVIYVDGMHIGEADPGVLRDRQKLAKDGIVTCVCAISSRSHRIMEVDMSARGTSFMDDIEMFEQAEVAVREAVAQANVDGAIGVDTIRKTVRSSLLKFLWANTHTRPMVIPVVMEV